MKIQELAIIFIIIILPISLLLSEYTQFQIQTIKLQTEYDARLTSATYDAIKAFQLNAANSTTSDLSNSKMRDLEASIETFRNSIMTGFELNGYTEEDLNNYIPALVYTLYDGFYIYSPYENTHDESGNRVSGDTDAIYGLKPYINYSCRYVKENIDVVITYALDNYITVQGMMPDESGNIVYVNKSGYLIDGITYNLSTGNVTYNNIEIQNEELKENLAGRECSYAKINGTKYYLLEDYGDETKDYIVYMLNGTLMVQYNEDDAEFYYWKNRIKNNDNAKQYYKKAYEFTSWLRNQTELKQLTYGDAIDEVIDNNGKTNITNIWSGDSRLIFAYNSETNIENELSNFNQHRLEVIRHKIETNLAIAISNYNSYSGDTSNVFQMPELKENEWDSITHNISLISFLQGLHIGGKIYNGYTIVTNSESQEVVIEDNIYILGQDEGGKKAYHKIGDKGFETGILSVDAGEYGNARSAGRLKLDFGRKSATKDNLTYSYYYPLDAYNASYDSIVMQNNVTTYDDIYEYVNGQSYALKEAFYTALGRERESKYNSNNYIGTNGPYLPPGYEIVEGTDMDNGFVIQDELGNQYVWIEVPKSTEVYQTAGLTIQQFTDSEYEKIEKDLKNYTSDYQMSNYKDEYYNFSGMTEEKYYKLKKDMLKSIYKNGGFYIGRYEAGISYNQSPRSSGGEIIQTPVIKKNAYPYNYVTVDQAQELAESFATDGYTTSLLFGVQWDLVLKYLETKGVTQNELISNSKSWGNFCENEYTITNQYAKYSLNHGKDYEPVTLYNKTTGKLVLLTTGASETFSKQNIYDLAGNLYEWTLERERKYKSYVERGNYYGNSTVEYSAGVRGAVDADAANWRGFRVTLLKK